MRAVGIAFDAPPEAARSEVLALMRGPITDRDTMAILDGTKPGGH